MRVSGWLFLLQQTFVTAMLLYASSRYLRIRLPFFRLSAGSLLCGILTVFACQADSAAVCAAAGICVIFLPALCGFHLPAAGYLRLMLMLFLLTFFTGGLLRAFSAWFSPFWLPLLAVSIPALPALDRRAPSPGCTSVIITLSGRQIRLTALLDSGNLLRDPLTALPVIVCSHRALAPFERLSRPLRLISVKTAAGSALMPVFRADAVHLHTGGSWRHASAVIGVAPEGYAGFQALVPASLTDSLPARPATLPS